MEVIKKVFEAQNLDFIEFKDFINSFLEFSKKFDSSMSIENLKKQIELSIGILPKFFGNDKKEYLESIVEFLDCFDKQMKVRELQEHLQNALNYLRVAR